MLPSTKKCLRFLCRNGGWGWGAAGAAAGQEPAGGGLGWIGPSEGFKFYKNL